MTRLTLLIADDHAIVRRGLAMLIDSQPDMVVVAEAADGREALEKSDALQPDIVIMDVSMPDVNGLVATRTIRERQPGVAIVALTRHEDERYLHELMRAGASAYVLKQSPPAELLEAIRVVGRGGVYVDPAMATRAEPEVIAARRAVDSEAPAARITERETEVLRLVAIGHSNIEIASRLDISIKTVEVHKTNAMRKLGLSGRVDVIRYGVLQGWLYDT